MTKLHAEQLDVCKQRFKMLENSLREMIKDLKSVTESSIRTEESLKGMWHELRDQKALLNGLPDKFTEQAETCPARRAFFAKAAAPSVSPRSDSGSNGLALSDSGGRGEYTAIHVPRKVVYFFLGLGISLGAACYVLFKFGVFG